MCVPQILSSSVIDEPTLNYTQFARRLASTNDSRLSYHSPRIFFDALLSDASECAKCVARSRSRRFRVSEKLTRSPARTAQPFDRSVCHRVEIRHQRLVLCLRRGPLRVGGFETVCFLV
jgi:hypothetical protein